MSAQKTAASRPASTYGDNELHTLQRNTFRYFWEETNPENGLIPDNTGADDLPASIAGVGLALASYPVAAERSFVPRAKAVERTLATLRFLWNAPQGPMPDATGHRGFFYHFLDVTTGRRAWRSELSTIDTTILIAGALTAATYFDQETDDEREVRWLARNKPAILGIDSWVFGCIDPAVMGKNITPTLSLMLMRYGVRAGEGIRLEDLAHAGVDRFVFCHAPLCAEGATSSSSPALAMANEP